MIRRILLPLCLGVLLAAVPASAQHRLFVAGDSTAQTYDPANTVMHGWVQDLQPLFNADSLVVVNHAIGGRSTGTFIAEGRWQKIVDELQPGDWGAIQFGHNDTSPINSGRARGTMAGTDDAPQTFVMEKEGSPVTVYTYGHYLRMMVRQAKQRGATPVIVSPTPQNRWEGAKIDRFTDTYNAWSRQVAAEEGVAFVDFNDIAAAQYEKIGREKAQKDYFADAVHTYEPGARFYCELLAKALKDQNTPLAKYVK